MDSRIALKRRIALEKELDEQYKGKIVKLPNDQYGMIDTIGVEWVGGIYFEVYVNVNNRRHVFYHTEFVEHTHILRQ